MGKKRKTLQERIDGLFKTKKAKELFEETQDTQLRKEIFKSYKERDSRKELADRVFSEYDRLYYSDDEGYCKCCTCGKVAYWRELQAGHYRSRGCLKYRFEIKQVYPQCYTCNITKSGNYRNYKIFMDKTVGPEQEDIYWNDDESISISQGEYENMIVERHLYIKAKKQRLGEITNVGE